MSDPIPLRPADYWELQAKSERVRALEGERALWLADHAHRFREAQQSRAAVLRRIAEAYGLDPVCDYTSDDATLSLRAR